MSAATGRLHVRRHIRRARRRVKPVAPWLIAIVLIVGSAFLVAHLGR